MLILPSYIETIQSRRDSTWKIILGTNELTPEQAAEFVKLNQKYVFAAFSINEFRSKDLDIIASMQSELEFSEKPPSQRMRAVMYRLWEVNKEGYEDFELYYRFHMEKIIKHLKTKLPWTSGQSY